MCVCVCVGGWRDDTNGTQTHRGYMAKTHFVLFGNVPPNVHQLCAHPFDSLGGKGQKGGGFFNRKKRKEIPVIHSLNLDLYAMFTSSMTWSWPNKTLHFTSFFSAAVTLVVVVMIVAQWHSIQHFPLSAIHHHHHHKIPFPPRKNEISFTSKCV